MTTHQGSCHCGAVRFTYEAEIDGAISCNCSHCRRKGFLLSFGPVSAINIEAQDGAIATYQFYKKALHHHFCTTCGVATHAYGEMQGNRMVAVNVRCIPDLDLDALTVTQVNGAEF